MPTMLRIVIALLALLPITQAAGYDPAWAQDCKLGGLEGLTLYSLRHHFVSTLVGAGVPLLAVARLVGHRGVAMIERHYGHLMPLQAQVAADLIEAAAGGARVAPSEAVSGDNAENPPLSHRVGAQKGSSAL
jgi:hypothetical protein